MYVKLLMFSGTERRTPYDSPARWNGLPENPLNVSKKIEIKA
jgi:hypothetical protein